MFNKFSYIVIAKVFFINQNINEYKISSLAAITARLLIKLLNMSVLS